MAKIKGILVKKALVKKDKGMLPYIPLDEDGYSPIEVGANIGANAIRSYAIGLENKKHNDKYKIKYIGGSPSEARSKLWSMRPKLKHAIDSIANRYQIDPEALRYRLNHEGFVDGIIDINNQIYKNPYLYRYKPDDDLLFNPNHTVSGFGDFGLDDVGTLINEGKVKLINETWTDSDEINEKGRKVKSVNGITNADNIGITAATLKYHLDSAKARHPEYSPYDLNRAALIYFNRGQNGGETYIKKGGTEYKYK